MREGNEVETVIEQIAELPDEAQVELIQSILIMRAEQLGLDDLDDDR